MSIVTENDARLEYLEDRPTIYSHNGTVMMGWTCKVCWALCWNVQQGCMHIDWHVNRGDILIWREMSDE